MPLASRVAVLAMLKNATSLPVPANGREFAQGESTWRVSVDSRGHKTRLHAVLVERWNGEWRQVPNTIPVYSRWETRRSISESVDAANHGQATGRSAAQMAMNFSRCFIPCIPGRDIGDSPAHSAVSIPA